MDFSRRLLAHEGANASPGNSAAKPAGHVYDKLHSHLSTLLGDAGVNSLFVRSAKLTQGEFAFVSKMSASEGPTRLRACLLAQDPSVDSESAAMLFATFFDLITNFIGERLMTQVLRRAWPMLEQITPTRETTK